MIKKLRTYLASAFVLLGFPRFAIAESAVSVGQTASSSRLASVEGRSEAIIKELSSGRTTEALTLLQDLSSDEEGIALLRRSPSTKQLAEAFVASTNDDVNLYLGSVLFQTGDPRLRETMQSLASSRNMLKRTVAAQYLLKQGDAPEDRVLAYDAMALNARMIVQISQADLSSEQANQIRNISRDVIREFRLLIEAQGTSFVELLNQEEFHDLPAYDARHKQLDILNRWWETNRSSVVESMGVAGKDGNASNVLPNVQLPD